MEEAVKERSEIIRAGLGIIIFTVAGVWEYIQLHANYDLPQVMVVVPIIGCLAAVWLRKYSFIVLGAVAVMSVIYQFMESGADALAESLMLLPVPILFLMLGIAGGFLIRVLINGNKSRVAGIACCALGAVLTFGAGAAVFRNPLYPFAARRSMNSYAQKYNSEEYPVSKVWIYFNMSNMEYEGQVIMSDGERAVFYHEKSTGKVYDLTEKP